ncbi:hypothetical protein [Corynebacterium matruchotii]|uniref:hypothetical protein n=1 Tax=Corynebacterium matruchotii TaxID=43768 RepID=UPI003C6F5B69
MTILAAADRIVTVWTPRTSVVVLVAVSMGEATVWVSDGASASGVVATCGAYKRVMDVDNDMAIT